MAWNQPGRKPGKEPGRGPGQPRGPGEGGDNDPPGLEEALRKLNEFFGIRPARLLLLGAAALLLLGAGLGFHQVGVGEKALVLRAGRLHEVQAQGLHWNPPLLDRVRVVNVEQVRDATLTTDVITRDDNLLTLSIVLRYRVEAPVPYLLHFADAEAALLRVAESVLQEAAAGLTLAELTGARDARLPPEQLPPDLPKRIAQRLARYRNGLALDSLSLASVQPPADLRSAFADVQRAREEARLKRTQAEQEIRQARQQAEAAAARLRAAAELDRNRAIAAARQRAEQFAQALAAYRQNPAATAQQLVDAALSEVMGKTRTVLLGEQALAQLGIPTESLEPAPLPRPPAPMPTPTPRARGAQP